MSERDIERAVGAAVRHLRALNTAGESTLICGLGVAAVVGCAVVAAFDATGMLVTVVAGWVATVAAVLVYGIVRRRHALRQLSRADRTTRIACEVILRRWATPAPWPALPDVDDLDQIFDDISEWDLAEQIWRAYVSVFAHRGAETASTGIDVAVQTVRQICGDAEIEALWRLCAHTGSTVERARDLDEFAAVRARLDAHTPEHRRAVLDVAATIAGDLPGERTVAECVEVAELVTSRSTI